MDFAAVFRWGLAGGMGGAEGAGNEGKSCADERPGGAGVGVGVGLSIDLSDAD